MTAFPRHAEALAALSQRGRLRQLHPANGIDFASNDYLGLARSRILQAAASEALARGVPVGAGGSRLLRGTHPEHEALEAEAAAFFGSAAALYMGGGFQANQALFASLPMQGDLVLHDVLIHASAHEGIRLGRADAQAFRHNDVAHAEDLLRDWRRAGGKGRVWLAVESIYSMEGDRAPLEDLAALARAHEAVLVVDEAHATGVHGPGGRGLARQGDLALITLHTCGKGLGASGALICAERVVIDTLVTKARPFLFATAPAPLSAAIVRASLRALNDHPELQKAAAARIAHAQAEAARLCGLGPFGSQILPVIIGADHAALSLAGALQARGFDVRAIRPPTVPRGTARLRISVTGGVTAAQITGLMQALSTLQGEAR
ncbi:8-amino-7-oxononanoate synthase [Phaeovulum sp. W22_SRMD_FR3]|uniref:8-amino-7-oxononanoate synthase n=1 Tax=Phaeovulum sp. W22_SRMD_FR3 TaxID=3240274 RepID=UPI003F9C4A99